MCFVGRNSSNTVTFLVGIVVFGSELVDDLLLDLVGEVVE